ncbi:MAG TPA: phosphate ABC transporter substrate-binding protein PstS [Ignavibacteria bacterium]|nr:phosphate ABC transporter substrate-binding protein PstS [Bacteroidota bacterium]HRI86021.1 phosphate ABC transporter substrate-binding protein PstS [Ignavibacteria bacterium]HRJ98248.1 phosphate ABC transporter substrate-binding protein PstS [Ignavibacteria bacterium]
MYKIIYVLILSLAIISCGKKEVSMNKPGGQINGAGATFPYPIYSKWFNEYAKVNKDAKINYQSIGSGGGVKQITEGTVDFGASDSPMSDDEIQKANSKNNNKIIHIPTVIGSVVVTYNLPGIQESINLTGEIVSKIYMGDIKKWNDPKIKSENPNLNLPDKDIIVCSRTDGSGTTYVFTDYLGKIDPEWKSKIGVAKDVRFPVGQGGKGNEGVTGLVKQLEYSIGYVELVYALQNKLEYAKIKNSEGEYILPTLESLTNAADNSITEMPDDMRVSITNAGGKGSYPISSYTYILIYQNQTDANKGKTLKEFLEWALSTGESFASELGYAPLPKSVSEKALTAVRNIKVQ